MHVYGCVDVHRDAHIQRSRYTLYICVYGDICREREREREREKEIERGRYGERGHLSLFDFVGGVLRHLTGLSTLSEWVLPRERSITTARR
jgi:hypothetical protein